MDKVQYGALFDRPFHCSVSLSAVMWPLAFDRFESIDINPYENRLNHLSIGIMECVQVLFAVPMKMRFGFFVKLNPIRIPNQTASDSKIQSYNAMVYLIPLWCKHRPICWQTMFWLLRNMFDRSRWKLSIKCIMRIAAWISLSFVLLPQFVFLLIQINKITIANSIYRCRSGHFGT